MKKIIALFLSLLSAPAVYADCIDMQSADRRIKYINYVADGIYKIQGGAKQPTVLIFDKHERIMWADCGGCDKIQSTGNELLPPGWLITTNADQRRLIIRPQFPGSRASVNIETTRGRFYTIDFVASKHESMNNPYNVRRAHFCYPEQRRVREEKIQAAKADAERKEREAHLAEITRQKNMNRRYQWDRNSPIAPIDIRDDGKFTEFVFRKGSPVVGIFRVDVDGYDVSTRSHVDSDTIVVQSIAKQFTIRRQNETVCVFNCELNPKRCKKGPTKIAKGNTKNVLEQIEIK